MNAYRVIVGLSGGVDSAAAAYLLKAAGYDVIGVTLRTWATPDGRDSRCCEIDDARQTADILGIPYYVIKCISDFKREITEPFISEYINGRTPNPCVICNRKIKWAGMLEAADRMGAQYIATGHYAQIVRLDSGRFTVKQAVHAEKDQTYNSQEICFVTEGSHADFIEEYSDTELPQEGDITDLSGRVIGRHKGIYHYTVGQRKGLGVSLGYPAFVTEIDAANNKVILGDEASLFSNEVICRDVCFMSLPEPANGEKLTGNVKIRYHHTAEPAQAQQLPDGRLRIVFDMPVRAAAKGQSAVMYDEQGCIVCGGIIDG